jgi:WD40 repeat protein
VKSRKVLKKLSDIHTGKIIFLILSYYILFIDWVKDVVFSPNGEYLATGSSDGTVNLIETSRFEKTVRRFDK